MGSGESKQTETVIFNENKILTVNRTTLDVINESIISMSTKTINEIVQAAESGTREINQAKIKEMVVKNSKVNYAQLNKARIKFDVELSAQIQAEVKNDIVEKLVTDIANNTSADVLNKMMSDAEQSIIKNFGAIDFGGGEGMYSTNINNNNITSETVMNLHNIINTSVKNTINNSSVQRCMSDLVMINSLDIEKITIEDSEFILTQSNATTQIIQCVLSAALVNNIIQDLAKHMGVEIIEDKKSTTEADTTTKTKSSTEKTGIGEAVSAGATGIGTGISNIFGGGSSATIFSVISVVVICCILIIAVVGIVYALTNENTARTVGAVGNVVAMATPAGQAKQAMSAVTSATGMAAMANKSISHVPSQVIQRATVPNIPNRPPPLPPRPPVKISSKPPPLPSRTSKPSNSSKQSGGLFDMFNNLIF